MFFPNCFDNGEFHPSCDARLEFNLPPTLANSAVLETYDGAPRVDENLQMERDTKNLHVDVQIVEKSVPVNIAADMPETIFL